MKHMEEAQQGWDLEALGVSFLWLLWKLYECWDLKYWDRMVDAKNKKVDFILLHSLHKRHRLAHTLIHIIIFFLDHYFLSFPLLPFSSSFSLSVSFIS